MQNTSRENSGIHKLISKHKNTFRIPENLNHYSEEDYKSAERKYIKYVLMKGTIEVADSESSMKLNEQYG
jgi:hypothetical protein